MAETGYLLTAAAAVGVVVILSMLYDDRPRVPQWAKAVRSGALLLSVVAIFAFFVVAYGISPP